MPSPRPPRPRGFAVTRRCRHCCRCSVLQRRRVADAMPYISSSSLFCDDDVLVVVVGVATSRHVVVVALSRT